MSEKSDSGTQYQGRPEGAVRKCHRLSSKADYYERCEKFQDAAKCHQQSMLSLQEYLKKQISVSTRRQVELLIRRHKNRIYYLSRREEELQELQQLSEQEQSELTGSFSEAGDENARLYYSHNPTMLQDIKKSQVQFNNAMDRLHKLVNPEDITQQISKFDLLIEEQQQQHSKNSGAETPTGGATMELERNEKCSISSIDTAEVETNAKKDSQDSNTTICGSCQKSLASRIEEEESLVALTNDLPAVWRAKDRQLSTMLVDYVRAVRARDGLAEQVKHLSLQLEQVRHQHEQQQQQVMSCSNITYNTTATDPDQGDLTNSDTMDPAGTLQSLTSTAGLDDDLLCSAFETMSAASTSRCGAVGGKS